MAAHCSFSLSSTGQGVAALTGGGKRTRGEARRAGDYQGPQTKANEQVVEGSIPGSPDVPNSHEGARTSGVDIGLGDLA